MNRIFKVVWNEIRGSYMVCDENRVARGKTKSVKAAVVVASVAAMMGLSGMAMAQEQTVTEKIVENETFENINKKETSNYPLQAIVSATNTDASALTVSDSTFQNNRMTLDSTSGNPAAVAVAASNIDVTVSGSTFTNNAVSVAEDKTDYPNGIYGSAIGVNTGNLTVTESNFTGNTASSKHQTQGSAIYQSVGQINISGSDFVNNAGNSAAGGNVTGGAVSLWGVSGTIDNARFEGNTASIKNVSVSDEAVYGGALYTRSGIWGGENNTQLTVSDSTFTENRAEGSANAKGGAIYAKGDPDSDFNHVLNVENSTFEKNHADTQGGAIYALDTTTIISGKSSFTGNTAQNGGAIYNDKGTLVVQDGVEFQENFSTAQNYGGGAIYNNGGNITIGNGVQFVGNGLNQPVTDSDNREMRSAGGAIASWNAGSLEIGENVVFENNGYNSSGNAAWASGGAIYLDTDQTKVTEMNIGTGTRFSGNVAGSLGGAIYAGDSKTEISGTTFENNKAGSLGGAVFAGQYFALNGHGVTISGSQFNGNEAGNYGGAIASQYTVLNVKDTVFSDNKAGIDGGALYIAGSEEAGYAASATIENVRFDHNVAGNNGGAIYNTANSEIIFTGTNTFSGNTANGITNDIHNAGKITVASGTTTLDGGITGHNGTVDINGGKLVAPTIHANANIINLQSGTLQTSSEQVMATGLDAEGTITDANGLKEDARVVYTGGELALTDAKYNLDYAKSVAGYINNDGATAVTMLGELVGQTGPVSVSDLEDTGVVLATTDIVANEDSKAGLVVGIKDVSGLVNINGNDYTDAETHNNNLGAKTLTLENGGNAVLVTGGKTLTLTGDGNDLIRTDNGSVNVDIGHNDQSGTLNLGTDSAANGGTLSGTVTVSETGTVNVNGAEYGVNGNLKVSGTVNVNNGATLNTDTVTLNGSGTVNVAGTMKADTLTAAEGTTINVGDSTSAGSLSASSLSLNGGMMFLDPDWRPGIGIEGASRAAFGSLPNGIDGSLVAGRNSMYVLGETATDWTQNEFARSGRNWGPDDITAALAIRAPQTLADNGTIVVDGSLTASLQTATPNSATFADNSMLIVDAAGISNQAAITGSGNSTATVADSAALHVANAKNGQEIGILKDFSTITVNGNGWQGDNLTSNDAMIALNVTEDGSNGNFTVAATTNNAADIFPGAVPVSTMNAIWQNGQNDVDSANGGIAFLSRAADNRYIRHQDAVRTINGAAQMAVAAGVQLSNLQALNSVTEALENHVSLTTNTQQANTPRLHDEGADLWAAMLYRHDSGDGMKSGGFNSDINNNFGGLIVGSDYTWKLAGDTQTRVGAALSIGKGDSHSDGDYNYSKNDYDTYGINLYGSWNNRNVNIMADIGYMKGDNEVEQHLSQNLGGKLKADVDTEMWTAGIKGKYRIQTSALDITPHLGIRYTHLKTDSFSSHNTLGTVFNTDSESYNIWQMPLGVTLSKDYKSASGWTIKPKFDFSVIGAAGDTEAETRVRVPGVNAADSARADMMDSVSFRGIVGVEMQKDATSVGLSAGYQRSSTMNSTGFMLNIGHHF